MIGLVLCGGQSTRMGSDKGMLLHHSATWAQLAAHKLATLQVPVRFSVNSEQQLSYANAFAADLLIVDDDSLDLKGPLLGVLSAHLKHPKEDIFVLACDMPLMDATVLQQLVDQLTKEPQYQAVNFSNKSEGGNSMGVVGDDTDQGGKKETRYEAYIFTNNNEPEPLCGIYTSVGLAKILAMHQAGELKKFSMKFMLSQLTVSAIPVGENQVKYFQNFNAHAALNGL